MVSEGEYFEDLEDLENIEDEGGQTELYEHRRVVADSGQNSVRVDKFLMDHLRDTSRNRIQKAAEAGYTKAFRELGEMYHGGRGTLKDRSMAEYWYRKAAAAGDAKAERLLNNM